MVVWVCALVSRVLSGHLVLCYSGELGPQPKPGYDGGLVVLQVSFDWPNLNERRDWKWDWMLEHAPDVLNSQYHRPISYEAWSWCQIRRQKANPN